MFVELKEMIINLDQVSNVGFLDNKLRIVFNFSHSIEIQDNQQQWNTIADYRYFTADTEDEYLAKKKEIQDILLGIDDYMCSSVSNHYWVNKDKVSYVTYDTHRNRLIFNLSTSVTRDTAKGISLINDFVFWTYNTEDEFNSAILSTQLKLKGN